MSPEQLLAEAQQKRICHVALTDINNTSGILDFFRLAPKYNIKPVAGIDFRNGVEQKFVGIAKNIDGFCELNNFLSHYLQSGEALPERAPEFENAYVIYPASLPAPHRRRGELVEYSSLRENEFIGIQQKAFFQLQTSNFKPQTTNNLRSLAHPKT